MLLVRSLEFALDRMDSTGTLVERALAAVAPSVPVWIFLRESDHKKVSASARALKKYPALAGLGPTPRGTLRPILSSLPRPHDTETFSVPIARELALAVAHDVPSSLPFGSSNVHLGPVPELWLAPGPPPPVTRLDDRMPVRDCLATIVVSSSWWTPRKLRLHASLAMATPPSDAPKLPPLPPATQRVLDALGRVHREEHQLVPEADEASTAHAVDPAAGVLVKAAHVDPDVLPHPELASDAWHQDGETFGSFKDELRRVLPSYRYQSKLGGRGIWVLTKRTAAHNELAIKVDRGPMGGQASASLVIRGPLWRHSVELPASATEGSLKVWSPQTTARLCENWGAAIASFERDLVPDLERLYWPGFAWYSPGAV